MTVPHKSESVARPQVRITTHLVLLAVFLGGVGGLAAYGFSWLLEWVRHYTLGAIAGYHEATSAQLAANWRLAFQAHPLVPVVAGVGGLIVGALVYGLAPESEGHGTDAVVRAYHRDGGKIRYRVPWVKGIASAITIGTGGAAGREGPTAQIAAGVGSTVAGLLKLRPRERRSAILMGMAAGLSAIFRSPLGTAIFAVEVEYSTLAFEPVELLYTLLSAAIGYAIMVALGAGDRLFSLPSGLAFHNPTELITFAILGLVVGPLAALLPTVFYRLRDLFHRLPFPRMFNPAIGALLLGVVGFFVPVALGGGYGFIQFLLNGAKSFPFELLLVLGLVKIVALSLTVSSGGSGGVFAPSLYVGACVGAGLGGFAHVVGLPANIPAMAVVGMAAMFGATARVPIATMVMVGEMTGGYELIVPSMVAVVLAVLIQGFLTRKAKYPSLYEAQVPGPGDSPVHHEEYYRVTAELLRKRSIQLEEAILSKELIEALREGRTIPISEHEVLGAVHVPAGSPWSGRALRDLDRRDVVFVALHRGESELVPRGGTVFRPGDTVVLAGPEASIDAIIRQQGGKSGKTDS